MNVDCFREVRTIFSFIFRFLLHRACFYKKEIKMVFVQILASLANQLFSNKPNSKQVNSDNIISPLSNKPPNLIVQTHFCGNVFQWNIWRLSKLPLNCAFFLNVGLLLLNVNFIFFFAMKNCFLWRMNLLLFKLIPTKSTCFFFSWKQKSSRIKKKNRIFIVPRMKMILWTESSFFVSELFIRSRRQNLRH